MFKKGEKTMNFFIKFKPIIPIPQPTNPILFPNIEKINNLDTQDLLFLGIVCCIILIGIITTIIVLHKVKNRKDK